MIKTKKWIAIIGSPRIEHNTDNLVDVVIDIMKEKGIVTTKYYLQSRNVNLCDNCEYCIKNGVCNIDDYINDILMEINDYDGIILAAPSYNYNVSAQMKVFLDRTFCLNDYTDGIWKSRLDEGKKGIIIGTCKGRTEDGMGYTIESMRKSIDELGVDIIDCIKYYNTKYNPVEANINLHTEIKNILDKNEL